MKKIKCPYCGYDGGLEYGTNMPFIDNLGVLKMNCAKCRREFNVRWNQGDVGWVGYSSCYLSARFE